MARDGGYLCQFPSANRSIILVLCHRENGICCEKGCCPLREYYKVELWETWYFWFGLILLLLFVLTSVISYLVTSHRQKQCQVIHIRNLGHLPPPAAMITTITGPGGIIQPQVHYQNETFYKDPKKKKKKEKKSDNKKSEKKQQKGSEEKEAEGDSKEEGKQKEGSEESVAAEVDAAEEEEAEESTLLGPLNPAYPVFQPLWAYNAKGVKFHEEGFFSHGANVVEISLPPGYVNNGETTSKTTLRDSSNHESAASSSSPGYCGGGGASSQSSGNTHENTNTSTQEHR